jgi:hypothetical protein
VGRRPTNTPIILLSMVEAHEHVIALEMGYRRNRL